MRRDEANPALWGYRDIGLDSHKGIDIRRELRLLQNTLDALLEIFTLLLVVRLTSDRAEPQREAEGVFPLIVILIRAFEPKALREALGSLDEAIGENHPPFSAGEATTMSEARNLWMGVCNHLLAASETSLLDRLLDERYDRSEGLLDLVPGDEGWHGV